MSSKVVSDNFLKKRKKCKSTHTVSRGHGNASYIPECKGRNRRFEECYEHILVSQETVCLEVLWKITITSL